MKQRFYISINSLIVMNILMFLIVGCKKNNTDIVPYFSRTTALFNPNKTYGTVTDIDGNIYKTIKIGNQIWMAENLRTIHFRYGDPVTNVKSNDQWSNFPSGAYCNYNNTEDLDSIATFGRLYNAYILTDTRNIAPSGWHIPNDDDWTTLINYLGGKDVVGEKLKETSGLHWRYTVEGSNISGFTALPGGFRVHNGIFMHNDSTGVWWSTTEWTNGLGERRNYAKTLYNNSNIIGEGGDDKRSGFSIRCIKD
jgi:uncharacterized protein (TIGR02145 family)